MRKNSFIKWFIVGAITMLVLVVVIRINDDLITIKEYSKNGIETHYLFSGKNLKNVVALDKFSKIDSLVIYFNRKKDYLTLNDDFIKIDTKEQITLNDSVQFTVPIGWGFVPDTLGVNYYFEKIIHSKNNSVSPFDFEYSLAVYSGTDFTKMSSQIKEQVHRLQEIFPYVNVLDSASFDGLKIGVTKSVYGSETERIMMIKKYIFRGGLFYIFSIRIQEEYYFLIDDFINILLTHIKTVDNEAIIPPLAGADLRL